LIHLKDSNQKNDSFTLLYYSISTFQNTEAEYVKQMVTILS